jgi:hypothetical protein
LQINSKKKMTSSLPTYASNPLFKNVDKKIENEEPAIQRAVREILADPGFQANAHWYMEAWYNYRGDTEEYRKIEDPSHKIVSKLLNGTCPTIVKPVDLDTITRKSQAQDLDYKNKKEIKLEIFKTITRPDFLDNPKQWLELEKLKQKSDGTWLTLEELKQKSVFKIVQAAFLAQEKKKEKAALAKTYPQFKAVLQITGRDDEGPINMELSFDSLTRMQAIACTDAIKISATTSIPEGEGASESDEDIEYELSNE